MGISDCGNVYIDVEGVQHDVELQRETPDTMDTSMVINIDSVYR